MNKREITRQARELIKYAFNMGWWEDYSSSDPMLDEGEIHQSKYIGNSLHFIPSGKYYTPFANGNVTACSRCKGKGCEYCGYLGSREAYEDQIFWEIMEETASKLNCWIESGEGDPLDTYLVREKENSKDETTL